ncbi:MAG: hypothetical protein AB1805_06065 [Nitrospirota bacterium]
MKSLDRHYGQFAPRIAETLMRCEGDPAYLERLLNRFKKAEVLPRAMLYKALIDKNSRVVDMIEALFNKELTLALLQYSSLREARASAAEIERELALWQQVWEEQ